MRKGKLISAFLVLVLLFAMCSCSNKSNNDLKLQSNNKTQIESQINSSKYTLDYVESFSEGYAWVHVTENEIGEGKNACIDENGKIKFILDDIVANSKEKKEFMSGYSVVIDSEDVNYILSSDGKIIASSSDGNFDNVVAYGGGYFAVVDYVNDFHTVEYVASILDSNGDYVIKDWIKSDAQIQISYSGDGIFNYLSVDGYYENDYKCYNAKTKEAFDINQCRWSGVFSNQKTVIYHYFDNYYELIDSSGNTKKLDTDHISIVSDKDDNMIFDNALVYEKDESLYLYDISSGKTSSFYPCGNGIRVEIVGYENGVFCLNIRGKNNSNAKGNWFVLVDQKGNNLFDPIEGEVMSYSCERIITKDRKVYDLNGKSIEIPKDYEIANSFNNNLLRVKSPDYNYAGYDDYMDNNGNLIFPNRNIE